MRCRLILEEFGPELIYIQGNKNFVAAALSRLEIAEDTKPVKAEVHALAKHFALTKEDAPNMAHPTNYKTIMKFQQKDKSLIETAKKNKNFKVKQFHGAGKNYSLICFVEIRALPSARADYISNQVELAWLTRYPQPTKIILDRGNEFLAKFKTLIEDDYGITIKPITAQNPQANAILERVHQTIGNIIRTMKVQDMVLDDENPWEPPICLP